MGERGPVGKRPDMRHRHESAERGGFDEVAPLPVTWTDPSEHWHPAARRWYLALAQSAQAVDYQQSDAEMAWAVAENLARHLEYEGPMGGNAMAAFLSANTDLLASAGARRRAKLELARPDVGHDNAAAGAVASLAARRNRGA